MLSPARYDALVPPGWQSAALLPTVRAVVVVASGGAALWEALAGSEAFAARVADPVDHHTRRALERALQTLELEGHPSRVLFAFETLAGAYADFVALGRAAGLGAPSRLGLLLHPEFGPWLSIRALVLTPLKLPETHPLADFDPCTGCSAPCQSACPTAAPGPEGFDLPACDRGRVANPPCLEACAARRACPFGERHAYPREAESHHMRFR